MWEIYTYDSWQVCDIRGSHRYSSDDAILQSLTFGRPPSFALAFIDCQMAEPDALPTTPNEEIEMSCMSSML